MIDKMAIIMLITVLERMLRDLEYNKVVLVEKDLQDTITALRLIYNGK